MHDATAEVALASFDSPLTEGGARVVYRRVGPRTVLARSASRSPVRLLTPKNHGHAAWVYLATFGGGLLAKDSVRMDVEVERGAFGLLGTQASTKVYRAPPGAAGARQTLHARVHEGGALVVIPDPIVCFASARYTQMADIKLSASTSSLVFGDAFTAGRSAYGERWAFSRYEARTRISLDGRPLHTEATRLDGVTGRALLDRMGRFEAVASLVVAGPRFAPVREAAMTLVPPAPGGDSLLAVSPRAHDGVADTGASVLVVRAAAPRFDQLQIMLRPCFIALARVLGDDPFARKW